jgi:hypothetical protein
VSLFATERLPQPMAVAGETTHDPRHKVRVGEGVWGRRHFFGGVATRQWRRLRRLAATGAHRLFMRMPLGGAILLAVSPCGTGGCGFS